MQLFFYSFVLVEQYLMEKKKRLKAHIHWLENVNSIRAGIFVFFIHQFYPHCLGECPANGEGSVYICWLSMFQSSSGVL